MTEYAYDDGQEYGQGGQVEYVDGGGFGEDGSVEWGDDEYRDDDQGQHGDVHQLRDELGRYLPELQQREAELDERELDVVAVQLEQRYPELATEEGCEQMLQHAARMAGDERWASDPDMRIDLLDYLVENPDAVDDVMADQQSGDGMFERLWSETQQNRMNLNWDKS